MIRSLSAVVAGYAAICLAVIPFEWIFLVPTTGYRTLSVVYSFLVGLAGGAVTAILARRAPFRHTAVLACIGVFLALVSVFLPSQDEPLWYQLACMFLPAAGVLLSGWLRERRMRARALSPAL